MAIPPRDPLGTFSRATHVALEGAPDGPLAGLDFAAKDVFHVAGCRTGFGRPDWLRTHPPAGETAVAVQALLDAGAQMVGKTHTDELAYSLTGENTHYGTPVNSAAPDRIPGGSSNGSVAAVAGGLVDFAIGTDCGGSVRLPASYCGVLDMRPSHGRVSLEGVIPFGPSFDACGWFAREAEILERVGQVLLVRPVVTSPFRRLLFATDAFEVRFRHQAMCLLCVAGLGGLPQISLPLARLDGLPLGLSLLGPRGSDEALMALARRLTSPP